MITSRRSILIATVVAFAFPCAALAQDFPNKPIRLVVPFPAGGPSDTTARAIATGLGQKLGQSVVIDNKPGAGAIVGSEAVLQQPADGYTLLMASNVVSTGKWLYPTMSFDPMRDFRSVAGVFKSPHQVIVAPDFKGSGIKDLLAMAKEKGEAMNYASSGVGTMPHLGAERFKQVVGVSMTPIPYRGSAPALTAVLSREVPVYFDIEFSAQSMLKTGKLRSLGVTSLERSPQFPDVPTLDEQGIKGFELYSWFGIVARIGTPDAIVQKLNASINEVMGEPDFKSRLAALGAQPIGGSPAVFQKMIESDYQVWGSVIKKANIQLD